CSTQKVLPIVQEGWCWFSSGSLFLPAILLPGPGCLKQQLWIGSIANSDLPNVDPHLLSAQGSKQFPAHNPVSLALVAPATRYISSCSHETSCSSTPPGSGIIVNWFSRSCFFKINKFVRLYSTLKYYFYVI